MTDPCSGLSVIFRGFMSHVTGCKTINIPEIVSGVHGFMGKTVIGFKRFKNYHFAMIARDNCSHTVFLDQ